MLTVNFLVLPQGGLVGFGVGGHAGWGEAGTDIVCAAVSSAVYLVLNTVTEVLGVTPLALRAEEGDAFFRLDPKDEPVCRALLQGLRLHLVQLEEQYPEHMKVCFVEVKPQ